MLGRGTTLGSPGDKMSSSIYFVGMNKDRARAEKYSIFIHDNRFISNDLFVSSGDNVTMDVRIANNTFTFSDDPPCTTTHQAFRGIGSRERPAINRSAGFSHMVGAHLAETGTPAQARAGWASYPVAPRCMRRLRSQAYPDPLDFPWQ